MRDYLFSYLSISQQAEILFNEGYYLSTREEPGFVIDMYQLESVFVELYFHREQKDLVVVKTFYSSEDVQTNATKDEEILYPIHLSWRNSAVAS